MPVGRRLRRLSGPGDPAGVLVVTFGDLASPLIAEGVLRYYLLHAPLPRLGHTCARELAQEPQLLAAMSTP